jgi:hypothetical protein
MGDSDKQKETGTAKAGLAGVAILVAPLITAVSGLALTGTIGRVQRDEAELFSLAIGLVIAAGTLWVLASTLTAPKQGESRSYANIGLRLSAFLLAAGGFVLAIHAAIDAANNQPRPHITPTLSEDGSKLTLHVEASTLSTEKRLAVRVDLLDQEDTVGQVYEAYIGPDADGNVDHTVTVPLPRSTPTSNYTRVGIRSYPGESEPKCLRFRDELEKEKTKEDNEGELDGTACVIITLPEYAIWTRSP